MAEEGWGDMLRMLLHGSDIDMSQTEVLVRIGASTDSTGA